MEAARKHLQTHKNFNLDDALRELEKSYSRPHSTSLGET